MSPALAVALALVQHEHHAMAPPPAPAEQAAPAAAGPPPVATDYAAERFYSPAQMASARAVLQHEHSGGTYGMVLLDQAEGRSRKGGDAAAFEGEAWLGDDSAKWVIKARGEHVRGEGWEKAELQGLYARPIGPYFDVRGGVRYDLARKGRGYATLGVEGVEPYWLHVSVAGFVSDKGKVSARLEGSYDLRLTQKLILQPRLEGDVAEAGAGRLEGGLRLRYEIRHEFAPYVGLVRERAFGPMVQAGERAGSTAVVIGVRAWL